MRSEYCYEQRDYKIDLKKIMCKSINIILNVQDKQLVIDFLQYL